MLQLMPRPVFGLSCSAGVASSSTGSLPIPTTPPVKATFLAVSRASLSPHSLKQPLPPRTSRRAALVLISSLVGSPRPANGAQPRQTRLGALNSDNTVPALVEAPTWVPPPTRVTAPGRIVAIGDLHGDLAQSMRALQVAGVIGLDGNRAIWTGGNTTLVQMGDILDRGNEEIGILFLLQRLAEGAEAAGGAVYVLNGNHEILNISGDFRYVTADAFKESFRFGRRLEELFGEPSDIPEQPLDPEAAWDLALRTRVGLFAPGGPIAQQFARNSTVLVVNDTVFAHGGLLPHHVKFGLERINEGVSRWMLGEMSREVEEVIKMAAGQANSVVWSRQFGKEHFKGPGERERNCRQLEQALEMVGAKRMVVGHTPQRVGCNAECDSKVWRIDVGLSRGVLGSPPQVLEIDGDNVRILGHWKQSDAGDGLDQSSANEEEAAIQQNTV